MEKKIKCLLIDDDPDDQDLFRYALQKIEFDIELFIADDGAYAMEQLSDENFLPDIIFIDLNMPRLNGIECIREIKKIDRLVNIPAYIYSTAHEYQNEIDIKQMGIREYIEKPNNVMELLPVLKKIFGALQLTA